jgi:glycosyltransferase involved in cell wall biosynthesis
MSEALQNKLAGRQAWVQVDAEAQPPAALAPGANGVVHLGSYAHERWSVQRQVLAVTDHETSMAEAARWGVGGRLLVIWHPHYWLGVPPQRKQGARAICYFHHHSAEVFDDPHLVAAICSNEAMRAILCARQPGKPVWVAAVGGVEDAAEQVRGPRPPTGKVRLLMAGNADAPMPALGGGKVPRKGVELILPIAAALGPLRHAWVFVGPGWAPWARQLADRGWEVIYPGPLGGLKHYAFLDVADVYLMLARLEGGPLTLLETMGLGIWPICTPTGIAPEVVRPGVNGDLVPAFKGDNVAEVRAAVVERLVALDADKLAAARPVVRQSVALRTWQRFKAEIEAIVATVFGAGAVGARAT